METTIIIFAPPSLRSPMAHLRTFASCPAVATSIDDRALSGVSFGPTVSVGKHAPSSIMFQEHVSGLSSKSDFALTVKLDKNHLVKHYPNSEEQNPHHYSADFRHQLVYFPGFWYLFPSAVPECKQSPTSSVETVALANEVVSIELDSHKNGKPILSEHLVALNIARNAVLASKEAATLADHVESLENSLISSRWVGNEAPESLERAYETNSEVITVKSRRLVQRRLKRRKIPMNPKVEDLELPISTHKHLPSNIKSAASDADDPYRFFLSAFTKNPLLSQKEELEMVEKVQEIMRLEEVKRRLAMQLGREPTLTEWSEALGVNCQNLQECITSGKRSREKMISSNLRLVVHIAKIYQGKGLGIQDLLQEGTMGLMKSLEKFKPQANCRFATYAYWWIRQSMRKAIYLKSRTIRLPENVYALLARIADVRNSYKVVGRLPSNEDLAKGVGITVAKLEILLRAAQYPVSIQQRAWGSDDDVIYQEITADPEVEIPETFVAKQLMRHHVHRILMTLKPKERQILMLRYGIHDGKWKTLSEIGAVYGITKERVRQVESVAMRKLKQCLGSQDLHAYMDLLV